MKLSHLYSNNSDVFGPIAFQPGVNVVLGEIRLPENRNLSVHNLGKTTLAHVIDFCLGMGRSNDFFLFKHEERFKDFIFFLEVETLAGSYVTIRRAVESASKLSIIKHNERHENFSESGSGIWDHEYVAFERGKQIIDGLLGLTAIKPWTYREPLGYSLRTQSDFTDVFRLSKSRGKDRDWKPYVAHMLGFNADLVTKGYELLEQIAELERVIATLKLGLGATDLDLDQVRGLIDLKKKEVKTAESAAAQFDFALEDAAINTKLVDDLDQTIAALNGQRYTLNRTRKRIIDSLQAEKIQFRPEIARKLFEEAGVVFPDQIVKEFDDLVRFNREISDERVEYLKEELESINSQFADVAKALETLNSQRQSELRFLNDTESVSKFRELNQRIVIMKNELSSLERQRDALLSIGKRETELRTVIREREDQIDALRAEIDSLGEQEDGRYMRIRETLAKLCDQILGHKALVSTRLNAKDNIEFLAEYLDQADLPTSEDEGKSFKQVLCAAFDLAVVKVLMNDGYLRFVFHDGLFEGLDPRKKLNLIDVLRQNADLGIQQVLTVIDSDLPQTETGEKFAFNDDEVILRLHDEGPEGRLFRMDSW